MGFASFTCYRCCCSSCKCCYHSRRATRLSSSLSSLLSSSNKGKSAQRNHVKRSNTSSLLVVMCCAGSCSILVVILLILTHQHKAPYSFLTTPIFDDHLGPSKFPASGMTIISSSKLRNDNTFLQSTDVALYTDKEKPQNTGRIPNALFIGAQKAGTTALSQYLFDSDHVVCRSEPNNLYQGSEGRSEGLPHSDGSRSHDNHTGHFINEKETHFFDLYFEKGLSYYQKLYAHCEARHKIILDATPNHMRFPNRVRELYEQHGSLEKLKIFMVLREPVQREISGYNHRVYFYQNDPNAIALTDEVLVNKQDGSLLSFEETMEKQVIPEIKGMVSTSTLPGRSFYAYWLKRWLAIFDRKQILVLSYDELKADGDDVVRRLMQFLELPAPNETKVILQRLNRRQYHAQNISCAFQEKLRDLFEPLNQELYNLLENYPGPDMETRPFPKFHFKCK